MLDSMINSEDLFMANTALRYEVETRTVIFHGKPITLINRTPIYSPEQREKVRGEIEGRLYDVVMRHREMCGAAI